MTRFQQEAEDVLFPDQPILFSCNICNERDDIGIYNKDSPIFKIMHERHVCYRCAYWIDKILNRPIRSEVIGGVMYIANPFVHRPLHVIKGSFGQEYYIRKFDKSLLRVNNLWNLGEIPEVFRDELPDTANFLSLMTYQKLSKDSHTCNAKGCWDRYHCLRYNISIEKGDPFNTVPTSHHIGDEECPSFINIKELKV